MLKDKNSPDMRAKRIRNLRAFLAHLVVYIFVLFLLFLFGVGQNSGFPLLLFLGAAWGLGVALHGVYALVQ